MNTDIQKKKVVIVVMSGNIMLNFAGPSDVFTNANNCLAEKGFAHAYEVMLVSPTPDRKVQANTGLEISCPYYFGEVKGDIDTLIIAGNDRSAAGRDRLKDFNSWLREMDVAAVRRIASICGGAFALAEAGLLDGKKATTHWERSATLKKEFPAVQVEGEQFYVKDGNIYTSAGVSSGIDLALALVEEDHGRDIAVRVARRLVFYLSRPGFQSQFGNLLPTLGTAHLAHKLKPWLAEHLAEPLDIARIAAHLNMSTRNFTRVFHKQTGMPPAKYVEKIRVDAARQLLESTEMPIERIAEDCGLTNLVGMRRTFLRHLNVTPSDYRRTFRTALREAAVSELHVN